MNIIQERLEYYTKNKLVISVPDIAAHLNVKPSEVLRTAKECGIRMYKKDPNGNYRFAGNPYGRRRRTR